MNRLPAGLRRVLLTGTGAAVTRATRALIQRSPAAARLIRHNYGGKPVSLSQGPAVAIGASTAAALGARRREHAAAALVAGLGSGALGLYDDTVDYRQSPPSKGLGGHLRALAAGRATGGNVKLIGLGLVGLAAAALVDADRPKTSRARRVTDTLLGAGVIAGSANLINLFDLRPGRALKLVSTVTGSMAGRDDTAAGVAAGTLGAAGAALPDDLDERTMLGDCGANALGALVGVSLTARGSTATRAGLLAAIASLTLASEKVSFTNVIAHTPVLREVDELGRRGSG